MNLPVRPTFFQVIRPLPKVLVVSEPMVPTILRLGIWTIVVAGFYLVVLGALPTTGERWAGSTVGDWLLLLFPLFLLPYLIGCVKTLLRANELVVDGETRAVFRRQRRLADFESIRRLRCVAVNGTCEEVLLSADLKDGRSIPLYEGGKAAAISGLANEMAGLIGVEIVHSA